VGYRDTWLNHAGAVSYHSEVVLHAFDRELPTMAANLLDIGVGNGGSMEVWRDVLPEGSTVTGIDIDPACGDLGLPVHVGDVTDEAWVREVLYGCWFDLIIDSTGTMSAIPWVFLRPGGRLILEGYDDALVSCLVADVAADQDSWLPTEEIMRVTVYPKVTVVEKRHPRVVPYVDVMVGNFADVTGEEFLIGQGVKRVIVN
jgi:hypothetical protein